MAVTKEPHPRPLPYEERGDSGGRFCVARTYSRGAGSSLLAGEGPGVGFLCDRALPSSDEFVSSITQGRPYGRRQASPGLLRAHRFRVLNLRESVRGPAGVSLRLGG